MKFLLPLGSAGEIGATCFYLHLDETGILLDCGINPKNTGLESLPQFDLLKEHPLDFCLISHAHQDHIGALPFLIQREPHVRIISTPQTRAIAELTLHNSVSILESQLTADSGLKVYSHEEVDLLIKSIEYKSYDETFSLRGYRHKEDKDIKVTLIDSGHILGSAGIVIEYDERKIYFTSDINLEDQELQIKALLPKGKIDTIIIECTYGATDSSEIPAWSEEAERLAAKANSILNQGGSVLIPVFALGKMQEMSAVIWNLMLKGKLAVTDIYTGGVGRKISKVYDYNRYTVRRKDKEFELSNIPQKNFYELNSADELVKKTSIVLASSGMMLRNTTSYELGKYWMSQKNSAIFTVGYMDENTPGYLISNSAKGSKIRLEENGKEIRVRCEIEKFRFPSHARRESLLNIVDQLQPDNVILVHGELEAVDWMGSSILKKFKNTRVFAAEKGKRINL